MSRNKSQLEKLLDPRDLVFNDASTGRAYKSTFGVV